MYDQKQMVEIARQHWQEQLPQRTARLRQTGSLEAALATAARHTHEAIQAMVHQHSGTTPEEAWHLLGEEWILLPAEAECCAMLS